MKHIVALSGGKDSTAMALRLAECLRKTTMGEDAMTTLTYGPKMRSLTPRRQAFVEAWIDAGGRKGEAAACARKAGFSGLENSAKTQAYELLRDEKVLDAIHERCAQRVKAGLPVYLSAMMYMIENPGHPGHLAATKAMIEQAGMVIPKSPLIQFNIYDGMSLGDLQKRAAELLTEIGSDAKLIEHLPTAEAEEEADPPADDLDDPYAL